MDFMSPRILLITAGSFFTGLAAAWIIAKYGFKLKLVDIPNVRSSHTIPTPRGGGMGVPLATALAAFLFLPSLYIITALALVLSVFTIIDDRKGLPVKVRFGFQLVLAAAFIFLCKKDFVALVKHDWGTVIMLLYVLLAVLFITASTNFFNFMDGINGISGFMAIVSFGLLGVYHFFYNPGSTFPVLSTAVVFSTAGFLLLNFPRARVFMGDVGSIFIGNLFALAVIFQAHGFKEFLLLTLFQSTMYLDCVSTIILRLFNGENILQAHKKHLYQRLVHGVGWSHTRATILFSLFQLLAGTAALLLYDHHILYLVGLWIVLVIIYWISRYFASGDQGGFFDNTSKKRAKKTSS
jgi:Fuc2NAc and GlcNAc transferase